MSNSYFTTSQDLIDKLNESTQVKGDDGKNFLTNLMKGGLGINEDGDVERKGWAYYLQPFTNNEYTDSIAKKRDAIKKSKAVETGLDHYGMNVNQLVEAGVVKPGMKVTPNNLKSLKRELNEINYNKITPQGEKDNTFRTDSLAAQQEFQSGQLGLQTQALTNAAEQSNNQVEIARLDRGFDREQLQANTNLQLQLGMLAAEQQDQRLAYDRETNAMDRRDRAIAQILMGLGETASLLA